MTALGGGVFENELSSSSPPRPLVLRAEVVAAPRTHGLTGSRAVAGLGLLDPGGERPETAEPEPRRAPGVFSMVRGSSLAAQRSTVPALTGRLVP